MKAARRKLNEIIDQMLGAGHSVALISKETGASERTIFRMKAARHKQEVESDPLLAELADLESQYPIPELPPLGGVLDVLYGGPGAALPELAELADLDAILFPAPAPAPVVAPIVDATRPVPSVASLVKAGMSQNEAEITNRIWTEKPEAWAKWDKELRRDAVRKAAR